MKNDYLIQLIQNIDNLGANDLNSLSKFFAKISFELINLGLNSQISLQDLFDNPPEDNISICLSPGTATNAILTLSGTVSVLMREFSKIIKNFGASFTGGLSSLDETRKHDFQKHFINFSSLFLTIKNLEPMLISLTQPNLELSSKFNKAMTEKSNSKSWFFKSDCTSVFKEIIKKRESLHKTREALISSNQITIKSFYYSLEKIKYLILDRNKLLLALFNFLSSAFNEFSKLFLKHTEIIKEKIDSIDFKGDFNLFIKTEKICRYDDINLEFKPIDMSHPAFENIENPLILYFPTIYPISLAISLFDFLPEGNNEIFLKKNKFIFLLEEPDFDWCHIMDPLSKNMGFVPSLFIKKIGIGLGIIIKDPEPLEQNGISVKNGDFVSILDFNKSKQYYSVHTIDGKIGLISLNVLEILWEMDLIQKKKKIFIK